MTLPDHPRVAEVARRLRAAGVVGEVRELADSARTAEQAAAALGVPVGAIANSLVFEVDGNPLLVMTSGAHRVDTAKVAGLLGVREVRRATPEFVREHTGQAIGGVGPVGHPEPIGTLVDVTLARHDRVWAAAGHPHTVFPTTYEELLRITAGTAAEVDALPDNALPDNALPDNALSDSAFADGTPSAGAPVGNPLAAHALPLDNEAP